jgi:hypothetical protein
MADCPLCTRRKARRFCPALARDICPVCCGTKRLVEINCPSDCPYLHAAQRHPAAVVKRQQEQDLGTLLAPVSGFSERQLQLFFLVQSFIARFAPDGFARVLDADVADAVGALASTYETATRGVIYDHQSSSTLAERLRRELQAFLGEVGKGEGSWFERDAVDVLRAVERGARHEPTRLAGAHDDAYLELVGRVLKDTRLPRGRSGPMTTAAGASLIIP